MTIRELLQKGQEHTLVCGILNVTPDSFSDGNEAMKVSDALKKAERLINEGASILDVGGESTRPGFMPVPDEEEITRVVPVVSAIKREFDIPVSVDTRKSVVAREALFVGADMINDVSGLCADHAMADLIAQAQVPCCIMHDGAYFPRQDNYMACVCEDLKSLALSAQAKGISRENIVLDPGIGFGKTQEENLMILRNLPAVKALGYPVLLGCSRKSVIGNVLELPTDKRLEGTLATTALAVMAGVEFVRVHDVIENYRFIKMLEAVIR